jgi:hypothetical protein
LTDIISFVKDLELDIHEKHRLLSLDVVLKATPGKWWDSYKEGIEDLSKCKILVQVRFGTEFVYTVQKYRRVSDTKDHIVQ